MKRKSLVSAGVCAALMMAPATPVMADRGAVVGGIIGGIIGGAIANEANKAQRKSTAPRTSTKKAKPAAKPVVNTAAREANREVQTALNHFGYQVGAADGAIGPKSRAAISQYQAMLGYPPTGQLTEYERTILVTAYHRAVAGGPVVAQAAATHPMGLRGLLMIQRDEMAGIAPSMAAQPVAPAVAGAAAGVMAGATVATPEPAPQLPVLAAEPAPEPSLPSFFGAGGAGVSLASHCNQVGLTTNANGGMVTQANMVDANFALSEQFCLSRAHVMADGEAQVRNLAGFTPAQIAEQCAAFGPVMKDHVAALSLRPAADVMKGVESFILSSGMAPAQLSATARICLGVGYSTDNMEVAVGSALLLTTLGEAGYSELLGHHLSQGFGASRRPDLALDWYEQAVGASGAGLVPGMPDRGGLLQKAAYAINGRVEAEPAPALPVFAAPEAPSVVVEAVPAESAPVVAPVPQPTTVADSGAGMTGAANAGKVISAMARFPLALMGQ
jgi:peptidoglycan hydrolase-like protein with peptidoglycan-binding domain